MQFLRIFVSILAALSIIGMAVLTIADFNRKNPPVIECNADDIIEAPTNITDEELLKYVTVHDEEDGDITERVIVERQNFFLEKGLTSITFSVSDSDNNTVKLKKNIKFSDYHSPRIEMHDDLIISTKESLDFKNTVSVNDKYDGDISNKVKIISPNYNNLKPGEYDINFKVTNSFSDSCDITVKAIVTDEDYSMATIKLSSYIAYVKKGENLNFSEYITGITGTSGQGYTPASVSIDTKEFNNEKSGVYNVYYTIGSQTAPITKTRLIVVVEG